MFSSVNFRYKTKLALFDSVTGEAWGGVYNFRGS